MNTQTSEMRIGRIASAAALVALAGLSSAAQGSSFNFPNFDTAASQLQLNGATGLPIGGVPTLVPVTVSAITNGAVGEAHKTLSITQPIASAVGSVWDNTKQDVGSGFVTNFSFRIRDKAGIGANGFAFVIQNSGLNAMGTTGLGTGYSDNPVYPTYGPGISDSIAIVFDTWYDGVEGSTNPGGNFLAVQTRGLLPNTALASASLGSAAVANAFNDGNTHNVQILYTPGLGLQIFYDNLAAPILTVPYNVAGQLNLGDGQAYVGFTAATGGVSNAQRHEILNWSFDSTQIPAPATAGMMVIGGLFAARRRRSM